MKFKTLLETLLNNDSDELVNQVLTGSLNKQNESDFPMLSFRANFSDAHKEAFVNVVFIVFFLYARGLSDQQIQNRAPINSALSE